ncbi:MAG: transcriptional regulator NrdR [Candidatus Pacebacteria bacterium CG10_big_fil_rev_8_21_14_0_10_56_10]|nr:MAG: transcriptional regulator NrdR [Candidatus Pacebacteria bacterium CG10_big_fil_rev_8_21_14_0_10_56_10]
MQCPYCGESQTAVIDSRETDDCASIRRRRVCNSCTRRFTTYERVESVQLKVIKKDGTRQDFNRDKLRRGLLKATWKRPVAIADIETLLDDIERHLRRKETSEVKSWEIGNLALNRLRKLDPLSYLLFASVYRDFESLDDFRSELTKLTAQHSPSTKS